MLRWFWMAANLAFVLSHAAMAQAAVPSHAAAHHARHLPNAGAVAPLRTIDPADHQFDDLAAFGRAVGDARYVVLGEQTRGEGNVAALKVRLVQYLHEQMGFDVLAMESGMYEGARINQLATTGTPMRETAPGNVFYMYTTTQEVVPLFDYLDAQRKSGHPMDFASFDSQHSGAMSQQSLVADLAQQLTRRQSALPQSPEWSVLSATSSNLLFHMSRTAPSFPDQRTFFKVLDQADQVLAQDTSQSAAFPDGAGFWRCIVASIRSQARSYWYFEHKGVNQNREAAMARNALLLLQEQYPGRKVVIWTQDFHGQKASLMNGVEGMMQLVRKQLPAEAFYHVYFTGYDGRFVDYKNSAAVPIQRHNRRSLESRLHADGVAQGFVDLRAAKSLGAMGVDTYGGKFCKSKPTLAEYVDGVFYLDHIEPAVRLQP